MLPRPRHIPHPHQRVLFQRRKVGKVGDAGQPDDRHVQGLVGLGAGQAGGQGVLVVDLHLDVGHHPHHRDAGLFFQRGQAGAEDLHVPAELVDDQPLDAGPLLGLEQGDGAVQLGEHPAPVDVARQQDGGVHQFGKAHVDDVVRLQVDLGGAARPLDDDDVVFGGQALVGRQDLGDQLLFIPEVFPGGHLAPHLPHHDHLAAHVAGRFEQDGVHPHVRFHAGGGGLHRLGPAHLEAVPGDGAVQGHVLAFEGGAAQPVLFENAAQRRAQQAFARPGHGALHHDAARPAACRTIQFPHPSTSSRAASRRSFSGPVRTAVRYHAGPRPW